MPTKPVQHGNRNLSRIRDNQRRSRARRKEYVDELEQRVRDFERRGVQATAEVQVAARKVAEENKKLRALLGLHGVSQASIAEYLAADGASAHFAAHRSQQVHVQHEEQECSRAPPNQGEADEDTEHDCSAAADL